MSIVGQGHFFTIYIFQVLYVLCFTRPRYQVSIYRTIGPLVSILAIISARFFAKFLLKLQPENTFIFLSYRYSQLLILPVVKSCMSFISLINGPPYIAPLVCNHSPPTPGGTAAAGRGIASKCAVWDLFKAKLAVQSE